ncbi:MAG TPA: Gfo/Idh/MocA family oxidoreductase [Verrucomicrobiaceae bacterium]
MSRSVCRWGILGTANIARKNWQAIRDAGNATLVAVASRDLARSEQFISECQDVIAFTNSPKALGSYEALLAHPGIDAVYIPLPTGLRKEWVIRAAEAGKHVLAEKPVGCSARDVTEMIAACERHGVQFMDGVMFMHSRRLARLREILDDQNTVGELRRITLQFSFAGDASFLQSNIRADHSLEPFGCLGDLGWYCIRMALWAMRGQLPDKVIGRIDSATQANENGVPLEFSGALLFAGGISAAFYCSFIAENSEWVVFSGTKGYAQLSDFVLPFSGAGSKIGVMRSEFVLRNCQFDMREGRSVESIVEPSNNAPGSQESLMFRTFSQLVLGGKTDPYWPGITLKTQQVMDACLRSAQRNSEAVSIESPLASA